MQNGQHSAVTRRIQKFVRVPRCCQRTCFRFAIADNTATDQIGIVEHGPERMAERIPKLTALVNGPGVSGATWLGIPPGNENCRNSF